MNDNNGETGLILVWPVLDLTALDQASPWGCGKQSATSLR